MVGLSWYLILDCFRTPAPLILAELVFAALALPPNNSASRHGVVKLQRSETKIVFAVTLKMKLFQNTCRPFQQIRVTREGASVSLTA